MANKLYGSTIASTFQKLLTTKHDDGFEGSTAGSERVISTDDGDGSITESCLAVGTARVGIGTATPSSQLHIAGTNPQIRIGDDGAEDSSLCFMGNAQDFYIALDDTTDDLTIGTGTTIGTYVKMVIENGGNVGIGTSTPAQKLVVDGNILQTDGDYLATDEVRAIDGGGLKLYDDGSNGIFVEDGGQVGIGTTSPVAPMHIVSTLTTGNTLRVYRDQNSDNTDNAMVYFTNTNTGDDQNALVVNNDGTGDCATFNSDGSETMVIGYGGASNVGIGTASPSVDLDIHDTGTAGTGAGGNLRLGSNDGTVMVSTDRLGVLEFAGAEDTASTMTVGARIEAVADATWSASENGASLDFYTTDGDASQAQQMTILSGGNVGIGIAAPTGKLHVTQPSSSGAKPCLRLGQSDVDESFIDFVGTTEGDSTRSISTSTATASTKFGAVKVKINGTDKWIRIYDTAV